MATIPNIKAKAHPGLFSSTPEADTGHHLDIPRFVKISRSFLGSEAFAALDGAALLAWLHMVDRQQGSGQPVAYSRRELQKQARVSPRRAGGALRDLEALGLVERMGKALWLPRPTCRRGELFFRMESRILDSPAWQALKADYRKVFLWMAGRYDGQTRAQRVARGAAAKATGLTVKTIRSALAALVDAGLLDRHHVGKVASRGRAAVASCFSVTVVPERRGTTILRFPSSGPARPSERPDESVKRAPGVPEAGPWGTGSGKSSEKTQRNQCQDSAPSILHDGAAEDASESRPIGPPEPLGGLHPPPPAPAQGASLPAPRTPRARSTASRSTQTDDCLDGSDIDGRSSRHTASQDPSRQIRSRLGISREGKFNSPDFGISALFVPDDNSPRSQTRGNPGNAN